MTRGVGSWRGGEAESDIYVYGEREGDGGRLRVIYTCMERGRETEGGRRGGEGEAESSCRT